ncbi:energy transducer TonB [Lutibacter sp.]|uniref:energy transducer TonB n=1 Tax=Lutibacter sp. TaxID=1925666 RepID=UPI0035674585
MKTKKHPKANLENYSKLFVQLGLVLSLVIVYVLIQNKTFNNNLVIVDNPNFKNDDFTESIIDYTIEPPKEQPAPKKVIIDVIEQIDNENDNLTETIIDPVDPDKPVDLTKIVDVKPIIEEGPEDVPFFIIEDAPIFPGCEGTKEEMKACFSAKITKFVSNKFNAELASVLNLSSGIQRISVIFKIDKQGNIVEIQARSPHKELQNEAIRVVKLLPQMEPGKQRNKPVNVKYSLPIAFKVE